MQRRKHVLKNGHEQLEMPFLSTKVVQHQQGWRREFCAWRYGPPRAVHDITRQ